MPNGNKPYTRIKSPFHDDPPPPAEPVDESASQPPIVVVSQTADPHVHLGVFHRILAASGLALAVVGAAAVAQPQTSEPAKVVFVIGPPRMEGEVPGSRADDDPGKPIREIAYKLFEHYLDQSIDELYDALEKMFDQLKKHEKELTPEARRDLDRLPSPKQTGGIHIFRSVWTFLRPILCAEEFRKVRYGRGRRIWPSFD